MRSCMRSLSGMVVCWCAWLVIAASACRADVPTVAEECRLRNAALCDLHGLQYIVDGPCPPEARTIRRLGQQRCDEAGQAGGTTVQAQPSVSIEAPQLPPPRRDLAWVGRIERWLLPGGLVIGGGVLAALLLRILRGRRARPDVERAGPRVGWTVVQLLVAASLAVPLAYKVAGLAFQRVFASFDNHDNASPSATCSRGARGSREGPRPGRRVLSRPGPVFTTTRRTSREASVVCATGTRGRRRVSATPCPCSIGGLSYTSTMPPLPRRDPS